MLATSHLGNNASVAWLPQLVEDQPVGMTHQLAAGFNGLELHTEQRAVPHRIGQGELPQEIPRVIGQHKQSQPLLAGSEPVAGELGLFRAYFPSATSR